MNFNINSDSANEYNLFKNLTSEVINLYGIPVKYIQTEKINQDTIFGEHSHIKIDNETVHELYMLPSETESFGDGNLFSAFGMQNLDAVTMYVSVDNMEDIHPNIPQKVGKGWDFIIGNLVIFPNNKVMEVTNFQHEIQGNNNLFVYDHKKNVYGLSLKTYVANRDDHRTSGDITNSDTYEYNENEFANLEEIFNSEIDHKENIDKSATEPIKDEVIYPNKSRNKPIRNKKDENNPFGDLG